MYVLFHNRRTDISPTKRDVDEIKPEIIKRKVIKIIQIQKNGQTTVSDGILDEREQRCIDMNINAS